MSKCEICGSDLPMPDASGYQREHIVERCRDVLKARVAELEKLMREMRMYALGSDVSTRNLIERVDAALNPTERGE